MELSDGGIILFQGDSITDTGRSREQQDKPNSGAALGNGYAHFSAARILARHAEKRVQVFNRGISGNRIPDIYARVREDVLNVKPEILSVLIGVNDTWHHFMRNAGVPHEKFGRVYRQFLGETRAELPAVQLVLCEPFVLTVGVVTSEWAADMARRRAIVAEIAAEFSAVFVPFQAMFDEALRRAPAEYWLFDGVHPTPAGHALMAEKWLTTTGLA
jgi:lysophospholipase L1-like esterase